MPNEPETIVIVNGENTGGTPADPAPTVIYEHDAPAPPPAPPADPYTHYGPTASHTSDGTMSAQDKIFLDGATATNTPGTLVLRDSSGNIPSSSIASADSSHLGTIQLAGDLTGTAVSPRIVASVDSIHTLTSLSLISSSAITIQGALTLNSAMSGTSAIFSGNMQSATASIGTANITSGVFSASLSSPSGTVTTLGSTTANITTANITTDNVTTGNIATLVTTSGTITTLGSTTANLTTANITTDNVTTGNITTLNVTGLSTLANVTVNTGFHATATGNFFKGNSDANILRIIANGTQTTDLLQFRNAADSSNLASISGSGGAVFPTIRMTTSPATGAVMTGDSSGNAAWTTPSSIAGIWIPDANGYHAPGTTGQIAVGNSTLTYAQLYLAGSLALLAGTPSVGLYVNTTMNPGAATSGYSIYNNPTFGAATGLTITASYSYAGLPQVKTGTGTITASHGLYQAISTIGGTNNYGLYIDGSVGNGAGTVSQVIKLGSSQTGDMFQTQTSAGTVNHNINQYANVGIGGQNNFKRVRQYNFGNLDGVAESGATYDILLQATHATYPGSASYGLYVAEAISVSSGTSSSYVAIGATSAIKSGAGTYATSYGLQVIASSFATANYAATFTGGNVGINTLTPTAALDVTNGYLRALDGTNTPPTSGQGLEMASTGGTGYIVSFNRGTSAYRPLIVGASYSSFTTGNVGIVSTTPPALLTVGALNAIPGTSWSTNLLVYGGSLGTTASSEIYLASFGVGAGDNVALNISSYRNNGAANAWYTVSHILGITANSTPRIGGGYLAFNTNAAGNTNIGINTVTATSNALDVAGNASISGTITANLFSGNGVASSLHIGSSSASGRLYVANDATNYFVGYSGGFLQHAGASGSLFSATNAATSLYITGGYSAVSGAKVAEISSDAVTYKALMLLGNTANGTSTRVVNIYDNLNVSGLINGQAKPFLLDHPLFPTEKDFYHMAIEGPRIDLLYRGVAKLQDGKAQVNIDTDAMASEAPKMTPGTFASFTRNAEVTGLHNKSSFSRTRASEIIDGKFTILCEDDSSSDEVVWQVTAERMDAYIMHSETSVTDENGYLILEPEKFEMTDEMIASLHMPSESAEEGEEGTPDRIEYRDIASHGGKGYYRNPRAHGQEHPQKKHIVRTIPAPRDI